MSSPSQESKEPTEPTGDAAAMQDADHAPMIAFRTRATRLLEFLQHPDVTRLIGQDPYFARWITMCNHAIKDINKKINDSLPCYAVIGGTGVGKSTLINNLLGIHTRSILLGSFFMLRLCLRYGCDADISKFLLMHCRSDFASHKSSAELLDQDSVPHDGRVG
jgi:sigma54-dependent transcription regulator